MATVSLAQCWYFVEDVLRLDAGFDRWHRFSFFIHPVLLIVCPLINLARFVGRWLLFMILLPFRTVGGAIVLVGRGANNFADQCRSFIVFVSEFYEVPSRASDSDAQIGGYIVLPFSSGLRVLVLAKEEEDEDDEDDDDYEDCLPLLEGGDEQVVKTLLLLEGGKLALETSDHIPQDASPMLQLATKEEIDPKASATERFSPESRSFRFVSPVTEQGDHRFTYEEASQMEPAEQDDDDEDAERAAQIGEAGDIDEGHATHVVGGGDGDEYEYAATHVAEVTSPITFRTATASPGSWFRDKVGHREAFQEEANYSPRFVAQELGDGRREFEGSRRSGVSQRSLLEDSQVRRKEVDDVDRFYGSRVSPRTIPEAASHELHRRRRREVEEDESRASPRSVPEVSQGRLADDNRREVEEGDRFYTSYAERVAWFDQLNAERRSIVSAVWNITLGSESLQKRIDSLDVSYRGPAHRKLAKCLENDFEVIYVGQTCLCWEALQYQYRKVKDKLFQDPSLTSFDATTASRFQRFKILLERFMETEKFCGERLWNYDHSRFSTRTLLQVPEVSAYNLRGGGGRGEVVTANKLLDAIESAIRTFWSFIMTDDKKAPTPTPRILPWTAYPVEDPRDITLWTQVKNETHKKKVKLKELLKKRKVMTSSGAEVHIETLMCVIDLQVVLRVLKMSVITTRQLAFCLEKLRSLRIDHGDLGRLTSRCLFPYA